MFDYFIKLVKDGKENEAVKHVEKLIGGKLRNWIKKDFGLTEDDSYEIYNDTIVDVIHNIKAKPDIKLIAKYFYIIAKRKALRRKSREKAFAEKIESHYKSKLESVGFYFEPVNTENKSFSNIFEKHSINWFRFEAYKQLGKKCQKILLLKFVNGLSHEEIADELNLKNEGTSRSRLNYCKKQMKEKYDKLIMEYRNKRKS